MYIVGKERRQGNQGGKKIAKIRELAFLNFFFARINFREWMNRKNFAGINFREWGGKKYFAG